MKKNFTLFISLLLSSVGFAQIGGLSASKLSAYAASTVPAHKIEFEPSFVISHYSQGWDDLGRSINYGSITYENEFLFRFTYGINNKLETGISLPTQINSLSWGVKYLFYEQNFLSMSLISGINFEFDNSVHRTLHQVGTGLVSTLQYSKNFSSDIDFQILKDFDDNNFSLFLVANHGLYIGHVQYIIETIYWRNFENNSYNFAISPGVTIEPARNFLMVLGYSLPIRGKLSEAMHSFSFALTITLE